MRQTKRPRINNSRTTLVEDNLQQTSGVMANLNKSSSFPNPRKLQLTQPYFVAKAQVKYTYSRSTSSFGGLYPYLNQKFTNSLYQPVFGTVPQFTGLTQLSNNFSAYICPRSKIKITVYNTTAHAIMVSLTPMISLPGDGQTTLQKQYSLPYTKKIILGSSGSGKSTGTLQHICDTSSLFGYDVTSVNSSNFITAFGANPSFESGILMIGQCLDVTNPITFDYFIEGWMDVIPLQAKQIF